LTCTHTEEKIFTCKDLTIDPTTNTMIYTNTRKTHWKIIVNQTKKKLNRHKSKFTYNMTKLKSAKIQQHWLNKNTIGPIKDKRIKSIKKD
jgi:hypothetical protein